MPRENEPLGDVATEVLFENDRVKIWHLTLELGEASDWHVHDLDYITVNIEGNERTVELEDGTTRLNTSGPGSWTCQTKHGAHRVVNNSNARHKNILIELKD